MTHDHDAHQMFLFDRQAAIKEAMRCHPGVSYPLERIVPEQGIVIAGVHFQAGTIIGMSAPVIHCNPDIFGHDADAFNPDRWLLSNAETIARMDRHLMTVSTLHQNMLALCLSSG